MIFVGNSQMICVLNAAQAAGMDFRAVAMKWIKEDRKGDLGAVDWTRYTSDPGKPDFTDATKAMLASSRTPIYSFIGGVNHVQLGLRRLSTPSDPVFDFVLPEAPDLPLDPDAEIVPAEVMREHMRYEFHGKTKLIGKLTQAAKTPVYQFAPPPVAPDSVVALLPAKLGVPSSLLPSRLLRWKLWRLAVDVVRAEAERAGARFVDYPPASVDANGCMREELARNLTHGNDAYGALVLDQITQLQ